MLRALTRYLCCLSFGALIIVVPPSLQANYVVFPVPIFSFIQSDYIPASDEISDLISLSSAPGAYEPVSFAIYTEHDLQNLVITASDLHSRSGHVIPASNIDLRIVKIWLQGGKDLFITNPKGIPIPELLVYDDLEPLHGTYQGNRFVPPAYSQAFHTSILPSKPASPPLKRETSKQFWLTVDIPSDAVSGEYMGTLTLTSSTAAPKQLNLTVTVLPIKLETPTQKFLIYYNGNLSANDADTKTPALMRAELQDIYKHGLTGFRIVERDISDGSLDQVYKMIEEQGFSGPFVFSTPSALDTSITPFLRAAQKYGINLYFYGLDEPSNDNEMAQQIRSSFNIHSQGGRVVTAITKPRADALRDASSYIYDLIDPLTHHTFRSENITQEKLDLANYHLTSLTDDTAENDPSDQILVNYVDNLRAGLIQKNPELEYYYWQSWIQKPQINRLLAGFFCGIPIWTGFSPTSIRKLIGHMETHLMI